MAVSHETVVYDVLDFKIYPLLTDSGASATYSAAIDVPGIAEVSMEPNFLTNELKGDSVTMAKKGQVDKIKISATYGKVSLGVLAAVLGGAVTDPTTTSAKYSLPGATSLPYFKAGFRISDLDVGLEDLIVYLYKGQLTGGTLLTGKTNEFGQPTLEIEGIPTASNNQMMDAFLYSVATNLDA